MTPAVPPVNEAEEVNVTLSSGQIPFYLFEIVDISGLAAYIFYKMRTSTQTLLAGLC